MEITSGLSHELQYFRAFVDHASRRFRFAGQVRNNEPLGHHWPCASGAMTEWLQESRALPIFFLPGRRPVPGRGIGILPVILRNHDGSRSVTLPPGQARMVSFRAAISLVAAQSCSHRDKPEW